MSEASFSNFFNNSRAFGLNVKVPERTIRQIGQTAAGTAGSVLEPIFTYLEENESVFNGDITTELNKMRVQNFNTTIIMQAADEKVNGVRPSFDMLF